MKIHSFPISTAIYDWKFDLYIAAPWWVENFRKAKSPPFPAQMGDDIVRCIKYHAWLGDQKRLAEDLLLVGISDYQG